MPLRVRKPCRRMTPAESDGAINTGPPTPPWTRLAGFEQSFAILVASQFAEAAHPRNLLRRQRRECLLETRKPRRQLRAVIGFISTRAVHTHLRLASSEANKTCRGPNPAICPVFFRRRHVVRRHQDCEV